MLGNLAGLSAITQIAEPQSTRNDKSERDLPQLATNRLNHPTVELTVQEAYSGDVGRCIARVNPATLQALNVRSGDVIMLGKTGVPAKIWRADHSDFDTQTVRIDSALRRSIPVNCGESLTLYPVNPKLAQRIALVFPADNSVGITQEMTGLIKRAVYNQPLYSDTIIPLGVVQDHLFQEVNEERDFLTLYVETTQPKDIVTMTEDTSVQLTPTNTGLSDIDVSVTESKMADDQSGSSGMSIKANLSDDQAIELLLAATVTK